MRGISNMGKTLTCALFFCCLLIVIYPGSVTCNRDALRKIMTPQIWFPTIGKGELKLSSIRQSVRSLQIIVQHFTFSWRRSHALSHFNLYNFVRQLWRFLLFGWENWSPESLDDLVRPKEHLIQLETESRSAFWNLALVCTIPWNIWVNLLYFSLHVQPIFIS